MWSLGEGCPRKKKNDGTQIQKSDQRETSEPSSAVIASFKGKGSAVSLVSAGLFSGNSCAVIGRIPISSLTLPPKPLKTNLT